jgi:L-ribulokinase
LQNVDYAGRYKEWLRNAPYPGLIRGVYIVQDGQPGSVPKAVIPGAPAIRSTQWQRDLPELRAPFANVAVSAPGSISVMGLQAAAGGVVSGLSATGDIFNAIARRADTTVSELSQGLEDYRAGQTGLLRMTWDNGDRTVLVNANLRGMIFGWNLQHTAKDELFAAIEGTAFHTRVILDRMGEYGTKIERVINTGGIPQTNTVLNQIYANVLGRPVLVPSRKVTSLGSAIFAFLAAGTFRTIEEAQRQICPPHIVYKPEPEAQRVYDQLYPMYRRLYFNFGQPGSSTASGSGAAFGDILPSLMKIARQQTAAERAEIVQ